MTTDIIFGSVFHGTSKAGNPFTIVHYLFKNNNGEFCANNDFSAFDKALDKCSKLTPGKVYKAEINYVRGANVLVDILE